MPSLKNAGLALLAGVRDDYGTTRIEAEVVRVQPNGELHAIIDTASYSGPGPEFYGLRIGAYVGGVLGTADDADDVARVWGRNTFYTDIRIERADEARAVARVLAALDKGLTRANERYGYLPDGDYGAYLFRVASILAIPAVFWRNSEASRRMTGDDFRRVDAAGLQSLVHSVAHDLAAGRKSNWVRS